MSESSIAGPSRTQPEVPASLAWLGAAGVAFGSGFAAVYVQNTFAPVGVFPLALGAITGFAVGGVWSRRGGGTKRAILLSALLAGLVCTATLHFGTYFAARRADEARRIAAPAKAAMFEPDPEREDAPFRSYGNYMTREWKVGRSLGSYRVRGAWLALWWTLDGLCIVGATMLGAAASAKPILRASGEKKTEASDTTKDTLGLEPDSGAAS
ncbi:MAG: hypothetical protein K8U03_03575 [Planctomycetia bacterium]|nr:hypothetical protein [Planctomycetia bacterium]